MRTIKEAYIGYFGTDEHHGIKIKALKNINPANAYSIDYVRYVANAFNFILGRFAYFSSRKNKPEYEIIITDQDLSDNIGCNVKHSSVVLNQVKKLFNLDYERKAHRGGARVIKLNQTIIDFLNVYDDTDLTLFIEENNINDSELIYALSQIYRYRVWGITDSKLSPTEKTKKQSFIDKHRDYLHRVASSNRSDAARINLILDHKDTLSEKERKQLMAIQEERATESRLKHYWYMVLIKLEQKVSAFKRLFTTDKYEEDTNHTTIDRNPNESVDTARAAATQRAQRVPEEPAHSVATYMELIVSFNNIIGDQAIPAVKALTPTLIQSIDRALNTHGKDKLLSNIKKVSALQHDTKYKYKITFERFLLDKTINFMDQLEVIEDIEVDWLNEYISSVTGEVFKPKTNIDALPSFQTVSEASSWLESMFK